MSQQDTKEALLKATEDLFFAFDHNLTQDSKNKVWELITVARKHYPTSPNPERWEKVLDTLQNTVEDYHNHLSEVSNVKLVALYRAIEEIIEEDKESAKEQQAE